MISQTRLVIKVMMLLRSARTPAEVREQVAMNTAEPGWILIFVEPLDLDDIHLTAVAGVGE